MFIVITKSIKFHMKHHKIPQLSSCFWWCCQNMVYSLVNTQNQYYSLTNLWFSKEQTLQFALIKFPVQTRFILQLLLLLLCLLCPRVGCVYFGNFLLLCQKLLSGHSVGKLCKFTFVCSMIHID